MSISTKSGKSEIIPSLKLEFDQYLLCSKYSPNKKYLVAGFTHGKIGIFESGSGQPIDLAFKEHMVNHGVPVTSIQFKPRSTKLDNSTLLATYADGKVRLLNLETGALIKEIIEGRQTLGSVYHPKLAKFITVGDNSAIYLYDEGTMQLEHTYQKGLISTVVDGHSSRVFAASFHPHQTTEFVSGGWDDLVHFWDMRQSNSLRFIKGIHMCGEGLEFSPSGRELLTCSYSRDNTLQLWHYHSGRLLSKIEPDLHKSLLYCGQWMSPDYIFVGGTDPSLARIISLKTLSTILSFKGEVSGVYSVDHLLKPGRTKRDSSDYKILFSVGKNLIEADVSL